MPAIQYHTLPLPANPTPTPFPTTEANPFHRHFPIAARNTTHHTLVPRHHHDPNFTHETCEGPDGSQVLTIFGLVMYLPLIIALAWAWDKWGSRYKSKILKERLAMAEARIEDLKAMYGIEDESTVNGTFSLGYEASDEASDEATLLSESSEGGIWDWGYGTPGVRILGGPTMGAGFVGSVGSMGSVEEEYQYLDGTLGRKGSALDPDEEEDERTWAERVLDDEARVDELMRGEGRGDIV